MSAVQAATVFDGPVTLGGASQSLSGADAGIFNSEALLFADGDHAAQGGIPSVAAFVTGGTAAKIDGMMLPIDSFESAFWMSPLDSGVGLAI